MKQNSKIYIHSGIHKTGSTALQAALRANEGALRQAGFLFPYAGTYDQSGRPSLSPSECGHHNLGWQIGRHWMFKPEKGTIAALADEISGFSGNIIISSESFESPMVAPENFDGFRALARETGRKLVIVVYLRDQLSYCESLYQELLKHRAIDEYGRHAREILETGIRRNSETLHHFDYENILGRWREVPDVSLIVRNYHALIESCIVADFAQLLGVEGALRVPSAALSNARESTLTSLSRFYGDRTGREPNYLEQARIRYLGEKWGKLTSGTALQRKFIDRFQASNLHLCKEWNIPDTGLDMEGLPRPESAVALEEFFSFETQCAIHSGVLPDARFAPERAKRATWMEGIEGVGLNVPVTDTIKYWVERGQRNRRWYSHRLKSLVLPGSAKLT